MPTTHTDHDLPTLALALHRAAYGLEVLETELQRGLDPGFAVERWFLDATEAAIHETAGPTCTTTLDTLGDVALRLVWTRGAEAMTLYADGGPGCRPHRVLRLPALRDALRIGTGV
jgi:hypothetical protein